MTAAAAGSVALFLLLTMSGVLRLYRADTLLRRLVLQDAAERAVARAMQLGLVNPPHPARRWSSDRKPSEVPVHRVLDDMPHH